MSNPPVITLIPNCGILFWDIDLDLGQDRLDRLSRAFWEDPLSDGPDARGRIPVALRELVRGEDGFLVDPATGQIPPEEQTYIVNAARALEPFLGKWVPLPFFTVLTRGIGVRETHDRGPTNWVRGRLVELPPSASGPPRKRPARLTLAFDTQLLDRTPEGPFTGPSRANAERQDEFAFASESEQVSWLLKEEWLDLWLDEMLRELKAAQRPGRALTAQDLPWSCEHLARYLVFLEVLQQAGPPPRLRMIDTVSQGSGTVPVNVDLVLDVGNSRTCGILVEQHPGQGMNLTDSYPLALRDLTQPHLLYDRPFESRVEFVRASLGRDALSRRSGRGGAFAWPSPVRVGPEAVRLAAARIGNEGATGISSPKRYLWDLRPAPQDWRFNGRAADGVAVDPPVGGAIKALVTEDGRPLRGIAGSNAQPAMRPRFSRSSLFGFMLAELTLQALCQINSPGNRANRRDAEKPRQLRRVVLTAPPGMPLAEQRILKARAEAGLRLAWDMLGWTGQKGTPPEPRVIANLDEATATQVVWLHNEITERMGGHAEALWELLGQDGALRVASIDVGGGTTDLMITTYRLAEGEKIVPKQEFRESLKIAGDDLLERVLAAVVVPCLALRLREAGMGDPVSFLRRILGADQGGQTEPERHLRRQFVTQVLEPAGLATLHAYERQEAPAIGEILRRTIGEILGPLLPQSRRAIDFIERAAREAGAGPLDLAAVEVVADAEQVEGLIQGVLGPALADLCEAAWHSGCDVLLLSGRPSRLRAVTEMVLAKMPVPPHRVVPMHRYQVGEKYPFRDPANRIDDPKTTAAVGAMLCLQAEEGQLRNFFFEASKLSMRSTARYIGRMDKSGQIRTENVLLANLDLDAPVRGTSEFTVTLAASVMLGFRQLPLERWTAQPLYALELARPGVAQRYGLPLQVKVRRREDASANEDDPIAHEMFVVDDIQDAAGMGVPPGEVVLRLQTLDQESGYWRDTGKVTVA
jgi:hypothetical protein